MNSLNRRSKELVWRYWRLMNERREESSLSQALHPDVVWHGFHPLRHLHGSAEIWSQFWQPLLGAMPDLTRRPYFFIGGLFEGDRWVCGTGDFIGTFANAWHVGKATIRPSQTSVHVRFGEFCKVHEGTIVEIRLIVDLPELLRQAGIRLLPPDRSRDIWIPGPHTGSGLLMEPQDPATSQKTLKLVEAMIFGGLNQYDQKSQDSQGLERFWHPHMAWHGPAGIGSAVGLEAFKQNAQGPILHAFPDRKGVGHQARIAEGHLAASTGWPSLVGTHQKEYLGWPATGRKIGWNIMDFWRREGDLLLENWVLIDLIGAAMASGVDLLARASQVKG